MNVLRGSNQTASVSRWRMLTWRANCLLAVLLVNIIWLEQAQSKESSSVQSVIPTNNVIRLFNGHDLQGLTTWLQDTRHEDPRHVFTAKDGILHISGDGWGGIATKEQYSDFHLICEFKWGGRTWHDRKANARDSGVLVHCHGPEGAYSGIWPKSIEAQIIEGGTGDLIVVRETSPDPNEKSSVELSLTAEVVQSPTGEFIWTKGSPRRVFTQGRCNWYGRDPEWQDVVGFRGKNDVESPLGEWTRMDVICDGGNIVCQVNGTVVNEGFNVQPTSGRIMIQSEMAEILIRRWELWPLGKAPPYRNSAE